jgi:putative two-component system response regulator
MKILIIEDELVGREKLKKLLQDMNHDILVAENGIEGWNLWKKERPRIVVTDWLMPELDGPDLCKRIREKEGSQYTYIIMLTSKSNVSDIVEGMNAGADDFIIKPFNKEEMIVRIRAGERLLFFEARDIVIFSMAKLAESRDFETGNHLERIRHYSKILADSLTKIDNAPPEIDNLFIENIFLTSPLHDIGKIGIPDYILLKQGRLDDHEFDIMKTHSIIGYETLNAALEKYPKADYLRMSAEIALSHHEKWNGTGYPNGLKELDIPLSARIVTVADVYDALVSKRVYKDAFTHEMAKSIILKEINKQFDPMIIDAFLSAESEFIKIYNQFKN